MVNPASYTREACVRDIRAYEGKLERTHTRLREINRDIGNSFSALEGYKNTILDIRSGNSDSILGEAVAEFRRENNFLGYLTQRREQYDSLRKHLEKRKADLEWILSSF